MKRELEFEDHEDYPSFAEVCPRTGKALFEEFKQRYPFPDVDGGEITFDNNVYEFVEVEPGKHQQKLVSEEPPEPFHLDNSFLYWQTFLVYYVAWQGPQTREDLTKGIASQLGVAPDEIRVDVDQALLLLVDEEILCDWGNWKFYFEGALTSPEHHGAYISKLDSENVRIIETNEDQVPPPKPWHLENPKAMARHNEWREKILNRLGGSFRVKRFQVPGGETINIVVGDGGGEDDGA